jgi:hypothetical protein
LTPIITYVSLVSDGGSSIAGGSMGDIIRFRGMNTYVPPNATCASICAFIWLAGSAKFVANSSHVRSIGCRSMGGDTCKGVRIGVCRLPQQSWQHLCKVGGVLAAAAG